MAKRKKVFKIDLQRGLKAEFVIDRLLVRHGYELRIADMTYQRRGIDRIAHSPDGRKLYLEYKTDWYTNKTGNVYIETVGVKNSNTNIAGWAIKSEADVLLYWAYPTGLKRASLVYVWDMKKIKAQMPTWRKYEMKTVENKYHYGQGHLVPVDVVNELAGITIMQMPKEYLK